MHQRAVRVLEAGGTVAIQRAADIQFVVDGEAEANASPDLESEFARKFVENAAVISLLASGCAVVNGRGYGHFRSDGLLD
jgi:hypothetical protein